MVCVLDACGLLRVGFGDAQVMEENVMLRNQKICPDCGVLMKRIYIGVREENYRGKKYPRYKAVGWACIYGCKKVVLDSQSREATHIDLGKEKVTGFKGR